MGSFQLLTEVYGEDCMSPAGVPEWHKRFSEDRPSMLDDEHRGHSFTAVTVVL
jgi:hypothetical protein